MSDAQVRARDAKRLDRRHDGLCSPGGDDGHHTARHAGRKAAVHGCAHGPVNPADSDAATATDPQTGRDLDATQRWGDDGLRNGRRVPAGQ